MLMETMYENMDVARSILNDINKRLDCTKSVLWGSWENKSADTFFKEAMEKMGEENYVTSLSWCFDKLALDAIFEVFYYAKDNGIPVIIIPEKLIIVVCKNEESEMEAWNLLGKEYMEMSTNNIKSMEETSNGMIFTYNSKVSCKDFEERPDYVYGLIENERERDQYERSRNADS